MQDYFATAAQIPDFASLIPAEDMKQTKACPDTMQINLGRLCNLSCKHCHLAAGPNRREIMTREVMEACLKVYREQGFRRIDITGGAPEMNPDFSWLVEEAVKLGSQVMVRTNLVVLLEEAYRQLPQFYADQQVELTCSLPYYSAKDVNRQRGGNVFEGSIQVLKRLNELGYGRDEKLVLNLVYNPGGAFFPPEQRAIEKEYRVKLGTEYGIVFNQLYTITNNPTGRFFDFLVRSGNLEGYMGKLVKAFNADTLEALMCRNQLSVGWDGKLFDCDFNQAAALQISTGENIRDLIGQPYKRRPIRFDKHCFACTAGAGSSCGGAIKA